MAIPLRIVILTGLLVLAVPARGASFKVAREGEVTLAVSATEALDFPVDAVIILIPRGAFAPSRGRVTQITGSDMTVAVSSPTEGWRPGLAVTLSDALQRIPGLREASPTRGSDRSDRSTLSTSYALVKRTTSLTGSVNTTGQVTIDELSLSGSTAGVEGRMVGQGGKYSLFFGAEQTALQGTLSGTSTSASSSPSLSIKDQTLLPGATFRFGSPWHLLLSLALRRIDINQSQDGVNQTQTFNFTTPTLGMLRHSGQSEFGLYYRTGGRSVSSTRTGSGASATVASTSLLSLPEAGASYRGAWTPSIQGTLDVGYVFFRPSTYTDNERASLPDVKTVDAIRARAGLIVQPTLPVQVSFRLIANDAPSLKTADTRVLPASLGAEAGLNVRLIDRVDVSALFVYLTGKRTKDAGAKQSAPEEMRETRMQLGLSYVFETQRASRVSRSGTIPRRF